MVSLISGLDKSHTYANQSVVLPDLLCQVRSAQELALKDIMQDATLFVRARRGETLSGDRGAPKERQPRTAKLIKQDMNEEGYVRTSRAAPQVALQALAIDEPSSDHSIDMLLALTPEEAAFYQYEHQVV